MPGAKWTEAYGIDNGKIVGTYSDGSHLHGFIHDGTTWTTLDQPGVSDIYATDIDGSIIVGYNSSSSFI
jgi:hypothetical protein